MKTTKQADLLKAPILAVFALVACIAASPGMAANVLNTISVAEGPNESQVIKIVMKDTGRSDAGFVYHQQSTPSGAGFRQYRQ
jgi:hypothetical protein